MSCPLLTDRAKRRIMHDISEIQREKPACIELVPNDSAINKLDVWITGPPDSIYEGERFLLRFVFDSNYPIDNPMVTFVPPYVPKHKHCYSNGHICLSILYAQHWSPAMTVESVCMSIISMLSSAKVKSTPPGDAMHSMQAHSDPRKTRWIFEDSKC